MKAVISFATLLVACSKPVPQHTNGEEAPAPAARLATPAAKPFVYEEKNDLIELRYGWPAEAAAVPQLVERFRKDMAKVKTELAEFAKEDKAARDEAGGEFYVHKSWTTYKTAGQSARLLSLSVDTGSYTGGAHGNQVAGGLLWDRHAAKEINVTDLFVAPANRDRLLTQRWCDALTKAREEKRGEPAGGGGVFDECSRLNDIAIIPTDKDKNGRFERLALTASPYVAGPYAEGSYEIELGVTSDLIAAIRSDYRQSFEAQPQ